MSEPIDFGFDLPASAGRSTPSSFLLDAVRRRESGRQALSGLTVVLFFSGVLLFMWPLLTDFYTEGVIQENLADQYADIALEVSTIDEFETRIAEGGDGVALTKIVIDDIGVETLVVEGTSASALRAGAGHYRETPLPGQNGNVAIAGHRTTYGKPFNRLDELDAGATIWLITPVGDYRYQVTPEPASPSCNSIADDDRPNAAACVTVPSDWGVVTAPSDPSARILTLTTCHPKGSAARRLIVRAELVESLPPGTFDAQRATTAG